MKRKIYGRKVGSKMPFTLMLESGEASETKTEKKSNESKYRLQFEIANTRRAVKTLWSRSIEGYVQFEGDSTRYAFTPNIDFDYPGSNGTPKVRK